jgi:hypothetical protein
MGRPGKEDANMKSSGLILVAILLLLTLGSSLSAKVTGVQVTVDPASFTGKCPAVFTFKAVISVDAPGTVKVQWKRSDGAIAPVETVVFALPLTHQGGKPAPKTITTTWTLGGEGQKYKEWQALAILGPNEMMSNRAEFTLECKKPLTHAQVKPPEMRRPQPVCIDPAAVEIRYSIVNRVSNTQARIRVTGIVKNIGNKAFSSGPGQAKAYLYELPQGAPERIVAQREILNLPVGGIINLVFERDWSTSAMAEFPPSYRLMISLDPDIYMDANKDNDDCRQENNIKEKSGMEINDLVRGR